MRCLGYVDDHSDQDNSGWCVDSCSTVHVTNDISDLTSPELWRHPVRTSAGIIYSTHKGTATANGLTLVNALCIPEFSNKIISAGDLVDLGWSV